MTHNLFLCLSLSKLQQMEKVINGEDFDPFGSTKLNNQNGKNNEKETRIDQ